MHITFRQLRVFTEIAQHGSMARAAKALRLRPAAYRHLTALLFSSAHRKRRNGPCGHQWEPDLRTITRRADEDLIEEARTRAKSENSALSEQFRLCLEA
jgi:hypothetical protein